MTVSLFHLYALRVMYAVLGLSQVFIQIPQFLHHGPWTLPNGAAHSFLLALGLLSLIGVRYPLQMLPMLFYELLWKFVWLAGFALPLWRAGQFDAATRQSFFQIAPVVVLIPFIPWRYVWRTYVAKPGDRWTNRPPAAGA